VFVFIESIIADIYTDSSLDIKADLSAGGDNAFSITLDLDLQKVPGGVE